MKTTTKTILTIGALAGFSFTAAQAATLVWDDGGSPNENWFTATNWVGDSATPANGDSVQLTQRNVLDYNFTVESGQSITDTVGNNWLGLANDAWAASAAELTLASGGTINVSFIAPRGNGGTVGPTFIIEDGASLTTDNGLDAARSSNLVWEAGTSSVTTWNTTNFTATLASTTVDLTDPLVGPVGALTLVSYSGTGTGSFASETITSVLGNLTLGADPGGDPFSLNAGEYFIDYGSGSGDSITLFYYVPEPSSTALLGLGGLALAFRRKRS